MRRLAPLVTLASSIALACAALSAGPAAAQSRPADLTQLPPVPTEYTPGKTAWGDWDFTGIWPIENIPNTRILFQRPKEYGMNYWLTDEQHAKRVENAERSDSNFAAASAKTAMAMADVRPRRRMTIPLPKGRLPPSLEPY